MSKLLTVLALLGMALGGCGKSEGGPGGAEDKGGGPNAADKYMLRAKTTEAIDQLDKMYKGAYMYFATPRVSMEGERIECQFPKTAECTPAGSPCKTADKRFAADPNLWAGETWSALMFQMNDAHYFRYCFESSGTGASAKFKAVAHADLDCDGVWSTFERVGQGEVVGGECSVQGAAAMFMDNELE